MLIRSAKITAHPTQRLWWGYQRIERSNPPLDLSVPACLPLLSTPRGQGPDHPLPETFLGLGFPVSNLEGWGDVSRWTLCSHISEFLSCDANALFLQSIVMWWLPWLRITRPWLLIQQRESPYPVSFNSTWRKFWHLYFVCLRRAMSGCQGLSRNTIWMSYQCPCKTLNPKSWVSVRCVVNRIMALQRCPSPNPWNLWTWYLTWRRDFLD